MKKALGIILGSWILLGLVPAAAHAVRVKDLAYVQGVRDNQLLGYGLVVGLTGTGDKYNAAGFMVQSLVSMLSRMGVTITQEDLDDIKVKNVAAVVVTATLPPFARPGSRLDVVVSSIGDAKSLQGGTLLLTPLRGPDGRIYAVAQGPLSIGGFGAEAAGTSVQKNHLTVGRIPGGALVERPAPGGFGKGSRILLTLHRPDFTTALRLAQAINRSLGEGLARPLDGASVAVRVPPAYAGGPVALLAAIESLDVPVDTRARVVLNERTGTVVVGEHVRLSTAAIAHGNLSIEIKAEPIVSQPPPFSPGATVVVPQAEVTAREQKGRLILVQESATIGELVRALNAVGVTPRDLISVFQALKAAGALQAELELM